MTDTANPLYYIGADRGTHWIPVHTTGCATFEEAEKVLALVRDGDSEGGPFARGSGSQSHALPLARPTAFVRKINPHGVSR